MGTLAVSDESKEMQQRYKNVFSGGEGRIVLGDILTLCHFGEILDPPEDVVRVAEYNVGLTIARMAGALNLIYSQLGIVRKEK
jgi:hypothetical protein